MCGIVGLAGFRDGALLRRMNDCIAHRGPDDDGSAEYPEYRVSLAMRRLSIIDVSHGSQPYFEADKKICLVYNGEIYNFREIRAELESLGHRFTTHADTEVILRAYIEWGRAAWSKLNGMFVFALMDARGPEPELFIVRDHFGIKPLFYAHRDGKIVFASEMKALRLWESAPSDINMDALWNYLMLRYVPGPDSIFTGIQKLPPGHELRFLPRSGQLSLSRWWSPPDYTGVNESMSLADAVALYGDALEQSVQRHMISDVPVGAYLSGGIDSTMIAALMSRHSSQRVKIFSIGFPDFPGNEIAQARETADHIGGDFTALECREGDLQSLPDIVYALDEPFGDAITLPMYVLARETVKSVKVVLSGEGADETLGGYLFHRKILKLQALKKMLPAAAWPALGRVFNMMPHALLDSLFDYPGTLGKDGQEKLARFLAKVGGHDAADLNRLLVTIFDGDEIKAISPHFDAYGALPKAMKPSSAGLSDVQSLLNLQFQDWLPDEILKKYDAMTMAHSLEGRVPFLDNMLLQTVARIPDRHKVKGDANKIVLREYAKTILPPHLLNRPKAAFYTPLESYVHSPYFQTLKKEYLNPDRIARRGLFAPAQVDALFNAPASHGFMPLKKGFSLLMLEMWFDRFAPDASWK